MLFAALGWILSYAAQPATPAPGLFGQRGQWRGTVIDVAGSTSSSRLTVSVDSYNTSRVTPFLCSVLIPNPSDDYLPGDNVVFYSRIADPSSLTDLPDENSLTPTFYVDGITAQANVAPDDIRIISSSWSLRRTARQFRSDINDIICRSPVSSSTAWFLSATLLGDDSNLDPRLREQFRATGIAHYLALSGFHIGVIALMASIIFLPFKLWSHAGRFRHLAVLLIVWGYAFVCGLAPSLTRAAILITVYLLAKVLQRRSSPFNSLCVAAVIILALSPRQLFAPGFQLSFCAVLSILSLSPLLNPFRNKGGIKYKLFSFVTVPVSAMFGTFLITIVHFHRFPLLFLIPNIIMSVLLPAMLMSGVIMMIFMALGIRLEILGRFVDFIYDTADSLCSALSSSQHTEITGIYLPGITIFLTVITIAISIYALHRKRRSLGFASLALLSVTVMSAFFSRPLPEAELFVTRQAMRTDILMRDHRSAVVVTSAPEREHNRIAADLNRRYSNYLSRRGCDSVRVATGDFTLPSVRRRGQYIVFHDKVIAMFTPDAVLDSAVHIDYLLFSRQSDIKDTSAINVVRPDTMLITCDTPQRRVAKIAGYCNSCQIPVKRLVERPFYLSN